MMLSSFFSCRLEKEMEEPARHLHEEKEGNKDNNEWPKGRKSKQVEVL